MSELYASTLKYFRLAITEFLPRLEDLQEKEQDNVIKEELQDLIEAYSDIASKIDKHNLNYDDPNRHYDGEPFEIEINIPNSMIGNLARLSHRLLLVWKEKLVRLKKKQYLTDNNKEEIYKLEHLIEPLTALLKEESYVLGKHAHLGPLEFPGESPRKDGDYVNRLSILLDEIRQCYILGDQEILENKRLADLETQIATELGQITIELADETLILKHKKLNSGFRLMLKSGFHNRTTAESKLGPWKALIEEIVDNPLEPTSVSETYFSGGQPFDAVKILREIFSSASTEIWIEDNFLHPTTITIIEPYIIDSNVKVRLLTRNNGNKNFNSFCVDLGKFKTQYPRLDIEARENGQCHDRYIIIDSKDIYHSGHSFHDLGGKASQINKVEDESNRNKILVDLKSWWSTGSII
ncbi:MAG TPA: hypothetical protein VJJ22_00595 [Candidatus Paceibacterota bacterium]